MEFDAKIRQKKRRGDDPRLDALADEIARDLEREYGEREGPRRGEGAPGVIVAGGLSEAKAHVAGLAVPPEVDHTTLEMRKVVIKEDGQRKAERASDADLTGQTTAASWKRAALLATIVTVGIAGAFGGYWLHDQRRERREERAAVTQAAQAEPAMVKAEERMPGRVQAVPSETPLVEVSPASTILTAGSDLCPTPSPVQSVKSRGGSGKPSEATKPPESGSPEKGPLETNQPPEF